VTVRIPLLQPLPFRTVADHDFAARKIELEKLVDALLDGYAADVDPDGSRPVEYLLPVGTERIRIHTARPDLDISEASFVQHVLDAGRRDERSLRGAVIMPKKGEGPPYRHGHPRANVLRKLCVIRGRERESALQAPASSGHAQRTLRCDVNGFGGELLELPRD
jgi:hypothetical protein